MIKQALDLDARYRAKVAAEQAAAPTPAPATAPKPTGNGKPTSKPAKGDRWQTYNAFHDLIAARLSLADCAVWNQMHRHAEGGVVKVTARRIAKAAGIQRTTVSRSLKRLGDAGLVWVVWLSADKSKPSIYGMHPRPGECLSRLPPR